MIYLTILEDDLNYRLEKEQESNDQLLVSGSSKGKKNLCNRLSYIK